jgi:cytochrome c556
MLSICVRLTAMIWLLSATVALAHQDCAPGVVKERCDLMKRQADDMKIMGEMAKGTKPFDAAKAAEAARDIAVTAKKIHERSGVEGCLSGCVRCLQGLPPGFPQEERAKGAALAARPPRLPS